MAGERSPIPYSELDTGERGMSFDVPVVLFSGEKMYGWTSVTFDKRIGKQLIHIYNPGFFLQAPHDKVELLSPNVLSSVPMRRGDSGLVESLTLSHFNNPSEIRFPQGYMPKTGPSFHQTERILAQQTGYNRKPGGKLFTAFDAKALDHSFGVAKALTTLVEVDDHLPPSDPKTMVWQNWADIKAKTVFDVTDLGTIATAALVEQFLIRDEFITPDNYHPRLEGRNFYQRIASYEELISIPASPAASDPSVLTPGELSEEQLRQAMKVAKIPVYVDNKQIFTWAEIPLGPDKKFVHAFKIVNGKIVEDCIKLQSNGAVIVVPVRNNMERGLEVMTIRETRKYSTYENPRPMTLKRCFPQGFIQDTDLNEEGALSVGEACERELREEARKKIARHGLKILIRGRDFNHTIGETPVDILITEVEDLEDDETTHDVDEEFDPHPTWERWRDFKGQLVTQIQDRRTIAAATLAEQCLLDGRHLTVEQCLAWK